MSNPGQSHSGNQIALLTTNPNDPSTKLINDFIHIHQQGQKYAVGDGMVGSGSENRGRGGSGRGGGVKRFRLVGRGKRMDVYSTSKRGAMIVGYLLLVNPRLEEEFDYEIDGRKYRAQRTREGRRNRNHIWPVPKK